MTGPPGAGKTTLAMSIAYELDLGPVLRWGVTSRTTLRDGLYEYDALGRIHDLTLARGGIADNAGNYAEDIGNYLRLGPLGEALVPRRRPPRPPDRRVRQGRQRSCQRPAARLRDRYLRHSRTPAAPRGVRPRARGRPDRAAGPARRGRRRPGRMRGVPRRRAHQQPRTRLPRRVPPALPRASNSRHPPNATCRCCSNATPATGPNWVWHPPPTGRATRWRRSRNAPNPAPCRPTNSCTPPSSTAPARPSTRWTPPDAPCWTSSWAISTEG
ncbi:hypothetical protein ACU686_41280 [Yinghuangia aomiensis]